MKNLNELKELSVSDLNQELLELRKEQFNLRVKKSNQSLEKFHIIGQVRKNIARINTLLSEKVGKIDV